MSGTGGGDQGGAGNPLGIRPTEPAPRPEGLTAADGLAELKASRARAEKQERRPQTAPQGRQAEADPPAPAEGEGEGERQEAGGEGEAQAPGSAEGEAEPRYHVEGVGELPVSELKRGYLRQADYTAKTQAAAAQQQQMAQAHQQFAQARDQLQQRLGQVAKDLGSEFDQPIDWVKLAREDPMGYQEKHARFTAFQETKREQEALAQQSARELRAEKERILQSAQEFLGRTLPGWKEPARRGEMLSDIHAYAMSRGYTAQDLAQEVLDPRQILVLHDAMQFRKMAGRKMTPQAQAGGGSPRGAPPAPGPAKREAELANRFEQDRSMRSAASLVSAIRHRPPGRR